MDIILCTREEASNYCAHYGVPGMKKGVLRWTNKDGTLTEAGKRHYGIGDGNTRSAPQQPKYTFSAHKPSSSTQSNSKPKFTFGAKKKDVEQQIERSSQNANNFPANGRKKNVTGVAKKATIGDAYSGANGPVSGQVNDSIQYEAYSNYLKELLPAAEYAQKEGMNLADYAETVSSISGNLAKEYLLQANILPVDVVNLFHDEMLQFLYNRWMQNPNSKFSKYVNERAAQLFNKK